MDKTERIKLLVETAARLAAAYIEKHGYLSCGESQNCFGKALEYVKAAEGICE
jgi:hypothetical protein